jgi:hypothetical protein
MDLSGSERSQAREPVEGTPAELLDDQHYLVTLT